MVALRLKVFLVLIFISFFVFNSVTAAPITGAANHKQVIIKKQINKNVEKNRYILPTVISGIFTFFLVFLVFYVRMKISKEIKRRQKGKPIDGK